MNERLQRLVDEATAAMYHGAELTDEYFARVEALTPEEKQRVVKAIQDYSRSTKHKTCACGQEFAPSHGNQRDCPSCRETKYNARHPLKTCAKCGAAVRNIGRNQRWCRECRRKAQKREEDKKQYFREFEKLPPDEQWRHYLFALNFVLRQIAELVAVAVEEGNPEEQPHANQARIDRDFRAMMDGVL